MPGIQGELVAWTCFLLGNAMGLMCSTYSCSTTPFTNGTCIVNLSGNYSLYPCSAPKSYCPTNFTGVLSQCAAPPASPSPALPYIGELCNSELPCTQGQCLDSRCTGFAQGAKCTTSSECDVGLRCYQGKCSALMRAGEWGCMSDLDCEVQSGCNFIQGRYFGLCTQYYSLHPPSQVTDCVSSRSHLCHSTYCAPQSSSAYPLYFCIEAPALDQALPGKCRSDADCIAVSRPWKYTGKCTCGMNAEGSAYCEAFAGDAPGLVLRNTLSELMQSTATCHTAKRLTEECYSLLNSTLYSAYKLQHLYFSYFPLLQNNDACVQRIFTSFYWLNPAACLLVVGAYFACF